MNTQSNYLSRPVIISIILLCSILFASNHIAARIAFDNGTGILLAIITRGIFALILMASIIVIRKVSIRIPRSLIKWQVLLGLLIAIQSVCLYSAIQLIPVAMALLLVNTWPMMFILVSWATGKRQPNLAIFIILTIILIGLFFVLDLGSSVKMSADWLIGISLGLFSAMILMLVMWIIEYNVPSIPGAVRSSYTMVGMIVSMCIVGAFGFFPNGLSMPDNSNGWYGLLGLSIFYGIAFTLLFVLAAKLDMGRNSPILNFEPVASLFLGYIFLGQFLTAPQLIGGAIVVSGIVAIGVMKK
ncbi:MAG: drug/metabolite transporter (DMT)-like permease [Bermanella sp.]|jgi:drug/metabolite transporter (DMT)-like permease